LIGGGGPGYALVQDLKKRSLTEKIRPVMPVTEKKTDYSLLSTYVLLHPKLGS